MPASKELFFEISTNSTLTGEQISNYRDRVVVLVPVFHLINDTFFEWLTAASKHAYGIVLPFGLFDYFLGYPEYLVPTNFGGVSCRIFTISTPAFEEMRIASNGTTFLNATIDGDDGFTPLHTFFNSAGWIILTIFMAASSVSVCVVSAIRLVQFFKATRSCSPMIATTCLWLEMASAFIRFLYWALDPLGSRGIIPYVGSQSVFRTAGFPFFISSTILLTFYWYESLTTTSLKISLNISKFRIPAYVMCAVAFIVETISWIYNLKSFSSVPNSVRSLNQVYYILVALGMSIFYFYTAIRILIALRPIVVGSTDRRSQGSDSRSSSPATSPREQKANKQMRSTTIRLGVSGVSLLGLCILAPMSVAPFYENSPVAHPGYIAWWCILFSVLNVKGLTTTLAFNPPRGSRTPSGSKTGTTPTPTPREV
eukprot:TRINITY_DN940_c0_g1_i3.p1 TRINITY_DN940_c0_g1~~TRINITY_DN940_c0_g1_i3.p1  ORF type:complete len:426 (-),score=39.69 TRINITY_DN940_c0_g1_i3:83-1360(-)